MSMGFAIKFGFWIASWLSLAVVGIFTPSPFDFGIFHIPLLILGLILLFYGLLLNAIAGRTLKKYGHFDIRRGIKKPEKMVDVGIYSCMRHPAQFGSIFFGVGIAMMTTNLYAILLSGFTSFLGLYFIMAIEERETLEEFGEEYCEFMKSRKPYSPSLKCLKEGLKALM